MANADKSLEIVIRTRAELQGAEDAAETLERNIGKAKALGKDYSGLEERLQGVRGAIDDFKKSNPDPDPQQKIPQFSEHAQAARAALKGLALEFPILGRLSSLVMNPMAASIAGISFGFYLWRRRIQETTDTLQSLQLPDLSSNHIGMVSGYAAAWNQFATAVANTRAELNSVGARHAQASAQIRDQLQRDLDLINAVREYARAQATAEGRPTDEVDTAADAAGRAAALESRRAQLANRRQEATDLEADSARKRAAALGIGTASAPHDADMQRLLDDAAKTARADRDKQQERIDTIDTALTPGASGNYSASLRLKLMQLWTGMSPSELREQAVRQEDSDLEIMRQADRFRAQGPERDQQRRRREELLSGAASSESKAAQIRAEVQAEAERMAADEQHVETIQRYRRATRGIQSQQEGVENERRQNSEHLRQNSERVREGQQENREALRREGEPGASVTPRTGALPVAGEGSGDLMNAFAHYHEQVVNSNRQLAAAISSMSREISDTNSRFRDHSV